MADGSNIPELAPDSDEIKALWGQQASQGRSNLAWSGDNGYVYFMNFEYLDNGKFTRAVQKVKLPLLPTENIDPVSVIIDGNLLDFDITTDALSGGDRPLIVKKNVSTYPLVTYTDMTLIDLSKIVVDTDLYPAWAGYAPEGARPVWLKDGSNWKIGYSNGGSIFSRSNADSAVEGLVAANGLFPRWNANGSLVYRRPHTP